MDFFEHQDDARKKTGRIALLFILVVCIVVIFINILSGGVYIYVVAMIGIGDGTHPALLATQIQSVPPALFLWVTAIVTLVILGSSFYRIMQLNSGGKAVAEMVGARKVSRNTVDQKEKQLINVVDEMAVASGIIAPQVYLMDEEMTINAFAAGYESNEAIISVTRGSLEQLNRDELQGVIAHEFSHILNGDMRINIRLMGVLYGIQVVGIFGGYILRNRTDRDIPMLLVGSILMGIGYVGVFLGRLIKAGISRQREFLADASAVQFTRNSQGSDCAALLVFKA